jgi:hypothetical protein
MCNKVKYIVLKSDLLSTASLYFGIVSFDNNMMRKLLGNQALNSSPVS